MMQTGKSIKRSRKCTFVADLLLMDPGFTPVRTCILSYCNNISRFLKLLYSKYAIA